MEDDESEYSHDSCSSSSSSGRSSRSDDITPLPVIDSVASCWDDDDDSNNKNDAACWTLQIKRVGETEPDFSVTVHPEDPLQRLLEAIGSHTGWSCTEQRLIYRGRLLTTEKSSRSDHSHHAHHHNNNKVRDIAGLTDGHTIHLMRKQQPPPSTDTANIIDDPHDEPATSHAESTASSTNSSSSLLAALLGVGTNNNNNNNRRVPYRLQESDLVRPDPGSLEAVRQGLLTLHTLQAESRPFYLGQWIDCRDTVNQWLEATVVNIVDTGEVLPDLKTDQEEGEENEDGKFCSCRSNATPPSAAVVAPTADPAIAVTDLDGRRRLLLEPCEEHEAEERLDGVYYRRRSNNSAVQLLHIHYNGWPARWDEWIRSDSERIRPFRVRTRHSPQVHASPTVTTPLPDPPRTHFTADDTEMHDREVLLPELHRAVDRVQELLQRAAAAAEPRTVGGGVSSPYLPWNPSSCTTTATATTTTPTLQERQCELQTLAPLLDRLGRVLTDAAPHVAALATTLQQQQQHDPSSSSEGDEQEDDSKRSNNHNPHTLGGLLSLLSRDRRGHEQSVASSNAAVPSAASWASGNEHGTIAEDDEDDDEDDEEMPVDPDLSDFRTGFVNSTRGELRRRSVVGGTNSDELASLLGAYLAAASLGGAAGNVTTIGADGDGADAAEGLGRLLRGGNGGGIDIHIHAVVTTPTGATAALFARDPTPRTRLLSSPTAATATFLAHAEPTTTAEDDGIFAALYSENPDPVNMNGNSSNAEESTGNSHNHSSTGTSSVNNNNNHNNSDHQRRRHRSSSSRRHSHNNNNNNGPTSSSNSSNGVLGRFFRRDRSNH